MNSRYVAYWPIAFVLFFIVSNQNLTAQSILRFSVSQLPSLVADAGKKQTINKGESVSIGGEPSASGGSGNYTYSWSPAKWLDNPAAANPNATPDSSVTYTLSVNDGKGCIKFSQVSVTVNLPTATQAWEKELGFSLYPNPNIGSFVITTNKQLAHETVRIEVYSQLGRLVHSQVVEIKNAKMHIPVEITDTAKGIYLFRLSSERLSLIRKVIVQ